MEPARIVIEPKLPAVPKVPLVTFEVLYSEREKNIRGSLESFEITGSPIGILVLVKEGYERKKEYEKFRDYAKRLIEAQGMKRYYVWAETDVDKLAERLGVTA